MFFQDEREAYAILHLLSPCSHLCASFVSRSSNVNFINVLHIATWSFPEAGSWSSGHLFVSLYTITCFVLLIAIWTQILHFITIKEVLNLICFCIESACFSLISSTSRIYFLYQNINHCIRMPTSIQQMQQCSTIK